MSECVVRMEMPLDCQYCAMAHWDLRNILSGCDAVPGKRYLQGKDDEFWKDGRPSWCPIVCQLPEGHGRLVDADELIKWFIEQIDYYKRFAGPICSVMASAYEAACQVIDDGGSIVPEETKKEQDTKEKGDES